jgi:hypothetical protein
MRAVVSSRQVQTPVQSDFWLRSYEYLPIDRWGGDCCSKLWAGRASKFGKKKEEKKTRGGGAHTSENAVIFLLCGDIRQCESPNIRKYLDDVSPARPSYRDFSRPFFAHIPSSSRFKSKLPNLHVRRYLILYNPHARFLVFEFEVHFVDLQCVFIGPFSKCGAFLSFPHTVIRFFFLFCEVFFTSSFASHGSGVERE